MPLERVLSCGLVVLFLLDMFPWFLQDLLLWIWHWGLVDSQRDVLWRYMAQRLLGKQLSLFMQLLKHRNMEVTGYCVFVDAEHALDPKLAEAIGVKTENLLLSQPDCGEQALSLVDTLIRSGSVDVVVVDSVAALVPKGELDGEMGDAHMAMQARLMSQALRKLSHSLSLSQTILIFINQVRSKLATFGGFGVPTEVTSGGNALKFYASVRLNIKRTGLVKKGEEVIGSQVLVKIVKNKHAPPFKTVQFELEFGKGICRDVEIVELGCKHKFITKKGGAFYSFNNRSFNGRDAIKRYLAENEDIREGLIIKLRDKIMHFETEKDPEVDDRDGDVMEEIISSDTTDEEAITAAEA
ncbi:DNA repair protein recA homolog 3, mitochondrial-like isoform X2 [Telopea speciosissima]|uniref:DNA repair protein recA homolog 3, mitochondrial-like isoform X2 n=1 Tax=Telopea speciosissima TaxID=54955 RepID=UPI001CC5497A|nr:DNA repair protein recA homolog 3, mitochondrial-like isoform X2 [Telopea speciosissima]